MPAPLAMHSVRSELIEELLAARGDVTTTSATSVVVLDLRPSLEPLDPLSVTHLPQEDADGDLELPRRRTRATRRRTARDHDDDTSIALETLVVSGVDATGTQLWRASLLMAEYLAFNADDVRDATVLELGCGVGFVAIAAARVARAVYATDGDTAALALCERNVAQHTWSQARVRVRHLPWGNSDGTSSPAATCPLPPDRFQWSPRDHAALDNRLDWIIASDVLYDDETADLFLDTLHARARQHRRATILVAAEKRVVFSAVTISEIALGFDAFQRRVCRHASESEPRPRQGAIACCAECSGATTSDERRFVATPIALDDVPHIYAYERVTTLQLWQLHAVVAPADYQE